jgi:hypothetical protein
MEELGQQKLNLVAFGITLWVSFLWAAIATMLFFATFDPVELAEVATFPLQLDRIGGYSIGFLLFWLLLIINSSVVNWLSTQVNKFKYGRQSERDRQSEHFEK